MKVYVKLFAPLCAICLLTSGPVLAESAGVTVDVDGCKMLDEFGYVVGGDLHQVEARSANGNIKMSCSQDLEPTSTGRSVIFNFDNTSGMLCTAMGNPTDDWHQVISRSGKAKLTCHYKAN